MTSVAYVSDTWETFNKLAKDTLGYAAIDKHDLRKIFLQIEDLIFSAIDGVLHSTTFIEDNICHLLTEIASGIIKSRKVYKGKRIRRRVNLGVEEQQDFTVEMGAENRRIFGVGFDLYKLSRTDREIAVPLIKRIIRTLRLSTSFYENTLVAFSKEADTYINLSDTLAEMYLQLDVLKRSGQHPSPQYFDLQKKMADIVDDMALIEMNVGCVLPNLLYGTFKLVRSTVQRVKFLQGRVLKAYSRLILKPVREKARSEMEAVDLFQSGSLGLARAISLYDLRSGTSFPTFANWWIRQKTFGATKNSGPLIKLPGSVWETHQKIRAAERALEASSETNSCTVEEIAQYMNVSARSIKQVIGKVQSAKIVPLDTLVGVEESDSDGMQSRFLEDTSVEISARQHNRRGLVDKILEYVDGNSRTVVCLRYGLIDSINNSGMDNKQILREIFRQLACKAALQQKMDLSALPSTPPKSFSADNY